MHLLSSVLEIAAVWANGMFIKMSHKLLHVKDSLSEISSGTVGMNLFEAVSICVNLRLSAVGFSLRSWRSFAANPFCKRL